MALLENRLFVQFCKSGHVPPVSFAWGPKIPSYGPGPHPASYKKVPFSFPGVKRPGRGVDHPPSI